MDQLDRSIRTIVEYNTFFNSKGIAFIFLPIPDKETIHQSDLPDQYKEFRRESGFLVELMRELNSRNVRVIDMLASFKVAKKNGLLYHFDYTHWNENAVSLASDLIATELTKIGLVH